MDQWLTVDEISKQMRVHPMTVYRLIKSGQLTAARMGRAYRIKREDFDEYLKGRQEDAGARI